MRLGVRIGVPAAVLCLAAAMPLSASETNEFPYSRRVWQSADGLPEDFAQSLAQSRDGYLWVGTSGGLVRFDGARFTVFNGANTPAFADDSVYSLHAGRDGSLWIGTEGGGLLRYRGGKFVPYGAAEGLTNHFVRALFEDRTGRFWAGTDKGLFRLEGNKFVRVDGRDGIPSINVHAIGEDRQGRLLVGGWGLLVLERGKFTYYTSGESLADNSIRTLMEASDGSLWIGTISGLRRLSGGLRGNPFAARRVLSGVNVSVLMESRDGVVWVGTYGHGLFRFEGRRPRRLAAPSPLPHDNVLALFEDREQNVWVGTQGGLLRLSPSVATTLTTSDGVPQSINTVYGDRDGQMIVVALNGKVYRVTGQTLMPFRLPAGVAGLRYRNAFRDRSGALWLGTDGQGVVRISEGRAERYTMRQGLINDFVRAFCQDRGGDIWIGTDGGVSVWSEGRIRNFDMAGGLVYGSIRFLHMDRYGTMWVGTDGGLSRLREGKFETDAVLEVLRGRKTWAIHEDADGGFWIGTHGDGLFFVRGRNHAQVTDRDGLPSNKIHYLAEDRDGHLWISTPAGVVCASRRQLELLAGGKVRQIPWRVYGISEGLGTNQMLGGVQPAGALTASGELWLPATKGLVRIRPGLSGPSEPPPVQIETALADDRPAPVNGRLVFGPGDGKLEIHYTAIRLRSPERLRFKYWMEGFDHNWTDAGTRRVAYYTNMPPGTYRFHVAAYEISEPHRASERAIEVHWRPHFYQTAWFLGFCGLMAAGLGGLLYWVHIRNLRQRFQAVLEERSRLAREMHDTLIQGCVGLSALLEAASHAHDVSPAASKELLERARQEARSTVEEARLAVWNLRHTTETQETLSAAVARLARQVSIETGIPVDFQSDGRPPQMAPEATRNLLLVVREALQNAVRHAAPQQLGVWLRCEPKRVYIRIRDDGCGFEPGAALSRDGQQYGLVGMRERVGEMGGRLTVESAPGQGTEVRLEVPLRRRAASRKILR
ncbi:MAG: two-component regulator propeller domain-containing protein [Bryobacterales bacterium]|nr:two-component regulator propeller domain-containing protein [Bryobacterales bacterium]